MNVKYDYLEFITSLLALLFCYKGLNILEGELWQITKTLHETIKKKEEKKEEKVLIKMLLCILLEI